MLIAIISTGLAIVLFLCLFLGFKQGLRLGMNTAKGIVPEKIKSPVTVIKEVIHDAKEAKKDDEFLKGLSNLMAYDGNSQEEEK